jgi:putative ABC transport system permease protein
MNLQSTSEGIQIAVAALRSDKVRAFLTILGIGIGVATVTGMGAIMRGVEAGISEDLAAVGPNNFQVARFDQTQIRFSGRNPLEGKPKITLAEGDALSALASVKSVTPVASGGADLRWRDRDIAGVQVNGMGEEWTGYTRGDFRQGRNFMRIERERTAKVAVISSDLAEQVFAERRAVGQRIRLSGAEFEVIGVYQPKPNLLGGGKEIWVRVPTTTAMKYLPIRDDWTELWVVPSAGYSQQEAMDEVTMAMRSLRRLKPADENNFAVVRQEAFAELMGKITGAVSLVMMVLSSIGLMVGGVGVVGIMLISVTERTREIGVRKALGARRGEILWQFLVEAVTVTVIGGMFGLAFGAGGALLLSAFTPIPAVVPFSSVVMALGMAAVTGILFGLYPANKAARLDPVDALRYE